MTYNTKSETYKVKGNIYYSKDSDGIYFNFYGPLGINVIKGSYIRSLDVYNALENKSYLNFEKNIYKKYDIIVDKLAIKYFLFGNIRELYDRVLSLNKSNSYLICNLTGNELFIKNKVTNQHFKVKYNYKGNFPGKISLFLGDGAQDEYNIILEYLNLAQ